MTTKQPLQYIAADYVLLWEKANRLKQQLKSLEAQMEPLSAELIEKIKSPIQAGDYVVELKPGQNRAEIPADKLWKVCQRDDRLKKLFFSMVKVLVTEARSYVAKDLLDPIIEMTTTKPSLKVTEAPVVSGLLKQTQQQEKKTARSLSI